MNVNYSVPHTLIAIQNNSLKALNNKRFKLNGYEYRIKFYGGFAPYYSIDRRPIGNRYFSNFKTVPAWHYGSATQAAQAIVNACNV